MIEFELLRVTRELSACDDLAGVMRVLGRAARKVTGADGVTLVLREGAMCHYADEDAIAPLWKGQRFPMRRCISGWSMLNRQRVAIADIYADPRIPHAAYRPTFVKSLAMVPIGAHDPVGALGAYWEERHEATTAELDALQALADSATVVRHLQLIAALHEQRAAMATEIERLKSLVGEATAR